MVKARGEQESSKECAVFCENELKKKNLPPIRPVLTVDWETRRAEIADLLQRELFGYRPAEPEEVTFDVTPDPRPDFESAADTFKITANAKLAGGKSFSFPFYAAIPKGKNCLPFFVHINFRNNVPDEYMPTMDMMERGFAVFSFGYEDVSSDDLDFTDKLAGILYGGRERTGADCGKIPMWSWAASRVMDFCATLDCLDLSKSAVIGHSRLGKTALYTGMLDTRFQFVISNESGFAGAAISRNRADRESGKTFCCARFCVEHHMQWFAPNYAKYADHEEDMPYDQHFLVAASAPRYVYVGSADGDIWSDPMSEYLSCCAAGEIYEQLGRRGFLHYAQSWPFLCASVVQGSGAVTVGEKRYDLPKGTHFLAPADWQRYMDFIEKAPPLKEL